MSKIRVTVEDPDTGESETQEVEDDYILVTAGKCYVSYTQVFPKSGTHQLTIKKGEPE